MLGGQLIEYGGIIGVANVALSLAVLAMLIYYFKARSTLDELSGRLLLTGIFLGIHELTFFLEDAFVYELTKTLFFIMLFYSLVFIVRHNTTLKERLEEQNTFNTELKNRMEEIKEKVT